MLVSNCFRFTDKGYIEVDVRAENGRCFVEVRDSGCGISEEKQESL